MFRAGWGQKAAFCQFVIKPVLCCLVLLSDGHLTAHTPVAAVGSSGFSGILQQPDWLPSAFPPGGRDGHSPSIPGAGRRLGLCLKEEEMW